MDDLLTDFLNETNEGLAGLDRIMLDLEKNPADMEPVRTIFRVIHTIKGTCGFLGLDRLENVAHATENVLGKMRDGELGVTPTIMGTLFAAVDRLRAIVAALEMGQEERSPQEDKIIIKALNACLEAQSEEDISKSISHVIAAVNAETMQEDKSQSASQEVSTAPSPHAQDTIVQSTEIEVIPPTPELVDSDVTGVETIIEAASDVVPAGQIPQSEAKPKEEATSPEVANAQPPAAVSAPPVTSAPVTQQFIRVHLDVLDNLITLISELVLTRNQLLQLMQTSVDSAFHAPLSRLSYITTELQEEVMKTRMQTIENAWAKFPRLIHDLCKELDKKIELVQIGGDTELDRQVLELIKDPLTHMVRNSADHGIETPEVRAKAGKNETGTITLKAFHEGGQIVIEISDDGSGIDPVRLKKKLVEKGMISSEELSTISDWQALNYIFKPGFSTASSVTHVSGRGVGMDVVKSNIEKLSGAIDLQSQVGKGTKFTIKIPLTLTIISALIFESQGQRFAIPQLSVTELVRVSQRSAYQIEYVNKTPVLRLRNGLLPLIFLENLLAIKTDPRPIHQRDLCVIVIHIGTMGFGVIVDQVFDTQEIVVKPLSKIFSNVKFFSGSTILGDGGIVLILDQNAIANQLKEINGSETKSTIMQHFKPTTDKTLLLVFNVSGKRYAVPLALVARIAEISKAQLENINDTWLIHYQEHLLPVAKFEGNWQLSDIENNKSDVMPLLIFIDRGNAMGLAIEEIENIVECDLEIEIQNKKDGSLGTTLINGQTTSIVDCEFYLKKAFPGWFEHRSIEVQEGVRKVKILFVDDSQFFRNLFMPLLTLAGFDVITAHSGTQGLQHLKHRSDFDIIISDIEMPEMSGFEFAKALRQLDAYKKTTLIAMTSRATENDMKYCYECGFNMHFAKTQQKQMIEKIQAIRKQMLTEEYKVYEPDND